MPIFVDDKYKYIVYNNNKMNVIDENSIKRIQSQLEGFHKSNGHYNFRCPYCGDSAKSKLKKRGWLFDYNGKVYYKCFNLSVISLMF